MSFNRPKFIPREKLANYDYAKLSKKIDEANKVIFSLLQASSHNLIAYSGGKDCIVMTDLVRKQGIKDAVCEMSFTFKMAQEDIKKSSKHFDLNLSYTNGMSWDFLRRNQEYCAPVIKLQSKVYTMRQQKSVKGFAKKNKYTGIVYGRRTEENTVRKPLYQLANGQWQCHPLRDWTLEDVWAYIYKFNLPYPRLYHTEIGNKEGFTPYLLIPQNFDNVWKAIFEVEPDVVYKFAEFHTPAQKYLENRNL
mgnify:CR=1 FL=1